MKNFKYNKEEIEWTAPDNICKECSNRLPDIGGIPGYNKITCEKFPDSKPKGVNLGRVRECPGFDKE